MYTDTERLRLGAHRSAEAAEWAHQGVRHLTAAAPSPGIFGDFAFAHAAYERCVQSLRDEAKLLSDQSQTLDKIAEQSVATGDRLERAEAHNAISIAAAGPSRA